MHMYPPWHLPLMDRFPGCGHAAFYYRSLLLNGNELSVGLTAANLGPAADYGGYALPSLLRLGAGYTIRKEGTRLAIIKNFPSCLSLPAIQQTGILRQGVSNTGF